MAAQQFSHAPHALLAPQIYITILTCHRNVAKQNAIRQSWLHDVVLAKIPYCFVMGNTATPFSDTSSMFLYLTCVHGLKENFPDDLTQGAQCTVSCTHSLLEFY